MYTKDRGTFNHATALAGRQQRGACFLALTRSNYTYIGLMISSIAVMSATCSLAVLHFTIDGSHAALSMSA